MVRVAQAEQRVFAVKPRELSTPFLVSAELVLYQIPNLSFVIWRSLPAYPKTPTTPQALNVIVVPLARPFTGIRKPDQIAPRDFADFTRAGETQKVG